MSNQYVDAVRVMLNIGIVVVVPAFLISQDPDGPPMRSGQSVFSHSPGHKDHTKTSALAQRCRVDKRVDARDSARELADGTPPTASKGQRKGYLQGFNWVRIGYKYSESRHVRRGRDGEGRGGRFKRGLDRHALSYNDRSTGGLRASSPVDAPIVLLHALVGHEGMGSW